MTSTQLNNFPALETSDEKPDNNPIQPTIQGASDIAGLEALRKSDLIQLLRLAEQSGKKTANFISPMDIKEYDGTSNPIPWIYSESRVLKMYSPIEPSQQAALLISRLS